MFKAPWRALSALALLAAIGCGDDGGTEPEGSISISASPTALSVPQGGSGTVNVTLTRGGGFAEAVNVTVEGLPAGVTASVNPTQLTGTTTQAVVTVNVANTVAAGSYTATIRASAAGIGAATTTYTLTVTAAGSYTLTGTAASVAQGASGTSTITIARTNFTGPVTLALDNPPAGITGTFNPSPATADQSTLTINVASTVAPGSYNLTVKGTATGQADKTATVALTVTAPQAANYTLTTTPATLPVTVGGTGQATVNIARTNFTGAVNLALDAPPTGITATFNPAAPTGNTSTVTVNVAGTVAPGNYTLTIKGTATGIADKTTTLAVTVAAAGTFTISAAPTALTIAPGANSNSTITIVRSNLTADVALSVVNPPTGITGTFTPATLTGTTLTSTLQVNVAGTVAPGTYPITVQGVGGSVTQTATINVTVAAGATVTLAMSPTTLSIQQGSSSNSTLTATRTNFTGNITPSVTGNPAGMTVTFNPTPITGNTSVVTVTVGAGVAAGTYPLTITGATATAGSPTTTLSVTVTAPTGGGNLTWDFCTADGVPLKFWRLSGTTWAEVTPTIVGGITRFSFSIAGTSGGVAFTMQSSSSMTRSRVAASRLSGMITAAKSAREKTQTAMRLANQTLPQATTFFDTFVQLGLTSELASYAETCSSTSSPVNKVFNVSGMAAGEVGVLGYGPGSASLSPSTPSYTLTVPPGTYDWAAVFGPAPTLPDFSSNWTAYRLGRGEAAPGTGPVSINRTGATAFATVPFTVTGGAAGSFYLYSESIEGARGPIVGFSLGSLFSSGPSGNMLFFAPADRLATDLTAFSVTNLAQTGNSQDLKFTTKYFGAPPANATFALPGSVPAFTVTQVAGATVPTWSVTGPIPAEYQTTVSPVTVSFEGNGGTALVTISATRGWLLANGMASTYTLTQPTLPNFLSAWAPAAPLASTAVVMTAYDALAAPTVGSTFTFAARVQIP